MAESADAAGSAAPILQKILTLNDPLWWLAALLIVVGLPSFFWKLAEVIRAVSSYHDQHRKTSHKIALDLEKLKRSVEARKSPSGKGKRP